jgi:opacity protein-like surface antigen
MKKLLLLVLILATPSLFAQDNSWRDRGAPRDRYDSRRDNTPDLTLFAGYRWGGTLKADTGLFNQDADLESSASFGASLDIPIGNYMKLELLANRQSTNLTSGGGGIFGSNHRLGDIDVTYYQAGVLIPFAVSRSATPYVVFSAGVATLDPKIANTSSANRFSTSIGAGVKLPLSRNLGIRFEGRGFYTSLNNNSRCHNCYSNDYKNDLYQGEANAGIYFRF